MLNIKVEKFEGPLGLLLQLIEKEELDITQVSLAKVADQYVSYIKLSPSIGPEDLADFLVVAARLLLIKSKALLPFLYPEEEEEIKDLERALKMYKEFLEAMKKIEAMIGRKKFMFPREFNRKSVISNLNLFSPPKNFTAEEMRMIFSDLLGRVKPPAKLTEEKLERKVSIEEKIFDIEQMLVQRIEFGFSKILEGAKSKIEVIVSFLAILELTKQRHIAIEQEDLFSEIVIRKF